MNSLSVTQVQVDGFDHNFSYLIVCKKTKHTFLIDPCGEVDRVLSIIKEKNFKLSGILVTHSHFDHHDHLETVLDLYTVPVYIHEKGKIFSENMDGSTIKYTKHEDEIKIGEGKINVFYTPGHNDDSVCFYVPYEESSDNIPKLITGDTVFVEGCGRTTASGVENLYDSLQFIKTLPDETEIYPGHDYGSQPISTVGREEKENKYFRAGNLEEFIKIRLPNG